MAKPRPKKYLHPGRVVLFVRVTERTDLAVRQLAQLSDLALGQVTETLLLLALGIPGQHSLAVRKAVQTWKRRGTRGADHGSKPADPGN